MKAARSCLRLEGYSCVSKVEDVFASYMVDVAYILEAGADYILVVPDEPEHINLNILEDREWLVRVVLSVMHRVGEENVSITFVPASS